MPKSPLDPRPDPLAREVDRLLAGLATLGAHSSPDHPPRGKAPGSGRVTPGTPRPTPHLGVTRGDRIGLWARVILGIGFGGVMTQWPYPHACDLPLLTYLGAVAMAVVTGVWLAVVSWGRRSGPGHILALALLTGVRMPA
jgi:hypothetical protein